MRDLLDLYLDDTSRLVLYELLEILGPSTQSFDVKLFLFLDRFISQNRKQLSDSQIKHLLEKVNFENFTLDQIFEFVDRKEYLSDREVLTLARKRSDGNS
ncbi:MAG: hypothetical protein HWD61_14200 [Parachlamydiaceae bacterium]|nr:MAG: hypothetical protein HWD61_14200 [Parachlamydiaceae bacterium]